MYSLVVFNYEISSDIINHDFLAAQHQLSLFCEFICTLFFIMKVFKLLCMRILIEQPIKNTSKYWNILTELIHNLTLKQCENNGSAAGSTGPPRLWDRLLSAPWLIFPAIRARAGPADTRSRRPLPECLVWAQTSSRAGAAGRPSRPSSLRRPVLTAPGFTAALAGCEPCSMRSMCIDFPKTKGSFEKPRLEMFGTSR